VKTEKPTKTKNGQRGEQQKVGKITRKDPEQRMTNPPRFKNNKKQGGGEKGKKQLFHLKSEGNKERGKRDGEGCKKKLAHP